VAIDLPTVVIEADAPRPLSVLGPNEVRALGAHAETTGLRAVELPEAKRPAALPIDPFRSARILRIEETLRNARGPLDLGDREQLDDVRTRVAIAYHEARAHPEDPEAPFLVGEALRTLARVEELAGDAMGSRALRARADLLDGGRRIGLSEGGPSDPIKTTRVEVTITLLDAVKGTELFIDGERGDAGKPIALGPGEHHLRIVVDSAPIVAQWFAVADASAQTLTVRAGPGSVACSAQDLAPAFGQNVFAVACARWLKVSRRKDAIAIRVCGNTSCGPESVWSTAPLVTPRPITETSLLRSKWTWIGVGAAAVIGGTITAWQLGAFDRKDAPPPTWRWEGVR
jgi:hypothetical protein